jgi:putative cardiolipin synthase
MKNRMSSVGFLACFFFLSVAFADPRQTKPISQDDFNNAATALLDYHHAEILFDNDLAFEKKLALVKSSKNEIIRLAYYIYTEDYSSAYFTKELIAAAKERKSKVRVYLDLLTNYKNLDFYSAVEKMGGGGIEFRFFNRPAESIVRSSLYMTQECPELQKKGAVFTENCKKEKLSRIARELKGVSSREILSYSNTFSKMFLAGLLAKNPGLMATGVLAGTKTDIAAIKKSMSEGGQGQGLTAEYKEGLKTLFKLYWDSEVHDDWSSFFELSLLGIFYSADVMPVVNVIENFLPVGVQSESREGKEWDFVSDYLHHKLITAGDRGLVLGGRNIEDSYHMRVNPLVSKYLFVDTDFYLDFSKGQQRGTLKNVVRSFDRMWSDSNRTISLSELRNLAPNDILVFESDARRSCEGKFKEKAEIKACVREYLQTQAPRALDQRIVEIENRILEKATHYQTVYLASRDSYPSSEPDKQFPLSLELLKDENPSSSVYYIENLPYEHDASEPQMAAKHFHKTERAFGYAAGFERESSKFIHDLWVRGIEQTCFMSQKDGQKRHIIFHNAYLFFPSNLAQAISKAIVGYWDCSKVRVSIVTNSIGTTDLNIINPLARTQLHALTATYIKQRSQKRGIFDLRFFEYRDPDFENQISLHSKVTIMGDDMIIGSANADPRSVMMDTNNGLYIHNAPAFVRNITFFLEKNMNEATREPTLSSNKLLDLTEEYRSFVATEIPGLTFGETLREGVHKIVKLNLDYLESNFQSKWNIYSKIKPETLQTLRNQYDGLMMDSYSLMLMTFADIPKPWDWKIDGEYAWRKNWIYEALGLPDWGYDSYYEKGLRAETFYYRYGARNAGKKFDTVFKLF